MITSMQQQGDSLWNLQLVIDLFRNNQLDQYVFKNRNLFNQLVYFLNEGYLNYEIVEVSVRSLADFQSEKYTFNTEQLDDDEKFIYKSCTKKGKYQESLLLAFDVRRTLYNNGARDFAFFEKDFDLLSTDAKLIYKLGKINLRAMFMHFKKGIEYLLIADEAAITGLFHKISVTDKYKEYMHDELLQEMNEKKLFSSIKKKVIEPSISANTSSIADLTHKDLVKFEFQGKILHGVVAGLNVSNIEPFLNDAYHEINDMVEKRMGNNSMVAFGLANPVSDIRTFIETEDMFDKQNVLVERFVPFKNGRDIGYFEFYLIEHEQLITIEKGLQAEDWYTNAFERLLQNPVYKGDIPIKFDHTIDGNGQYEPSTHSIQLNFDNIINSAVSDFTLYGTKIEDSIVMILAHELGHGDKDSQYLYDKEYFSLFKEYNEITSKIDKRTPSLFNVSTQSNENEIKHRKALYELRKKYRNYVLTAEMDAFRNGLKYVEPHLHQEFQKRNYTLYKSYKTKETDILFEVRMKYYNSL